MGVPEANPYVSLLGRERWCHPWPKEGVMKEEVTSPRTLAPPGIKIRIKGPPIKRAYVSHHDSNTALTSDGYAPPCLFKTRRFAIVPSTSVLIPLANLAAPDQTGNPDRIT